jgi:hypothetical protein
VSKQKKDLKKLSDDELERLWKQVGRNLSISRIKELLDGITPDSPVEIAYMNVREERNERKRAGVQIGPGGRLDHCRA